MPNQVNNHYHLVQTAAHNILSEIHLIVWLCILTQLDEGRIVIRHTIYFMNDKVIQLF